MSLIAPKKYRLKECVACGATYRPRGGNQRWCSNACREGRVAATVLPAGSGEVEPGAPPDSSPSLTEAVRDAVERNAQVLEWTGEDRDGDQYRTAAFEFVRWTRGHPALEDLDAPAAHGAIEPVLEALLTARAIPEQPVEVLERTAWTVALGDVDCYGNVQDPEQDFLRLWESLRPKPGLAGAVRDARRAEERGRPDRYGSAWEAPVYAPRRVFLGACVSLSVRAREAGEPGGTFALAVKPLAHEMGWPWTTVRDWRKWAEDHAFIVRVSAPAKGRAATFRLGPALGGSGC